MIAYTYAVPLAAALRLGTTAGLDFLRQALLAVGTLALVVARRVADALLRPLGRRQRDRRRRHRLVRARGDLDPPGVRRRQVARVPARRASPTRSPPPSGSSTSASRSSSIQSLSTDLEAGYYAAPFRIIETAANLPWMFVTSVFPILARAATRDIPRLNYAVAAHHRGRADLRHLDDARADPGRRAGDGDHRRAAGVRALDPRAAPAGADAREHVPRRHLVAAAALACTSTARC